MARRQAADYDQKRDLITKEAAKLFAKKGFDGASLSELAAACNTSKSLIYHYYTSKEAILYDVMRLHIDALLTSIDNLAQRQDEPEELFKSLARNLMRQYVGAADSQKVLLYELSNLPSQDQKDIIEKQRKIIDFAEDLLRRSAPNTKINHSHLRAHVMLFFGMLNWTHNWFKSSGAVSRDDIADMAAAKTLATLR
ncbi:MAG: TetR family transcriptional regulator [Hyphococcus sp.]|nr:MAG: TetR family transcriptional regulator [Marinicaulis sp.]